MVVDPVAAEFFRLQREDIANTTCCDSGSEDAQWASVSHGIYISIEASGLHRSLGVHISFVQSTCMDSWRPIHLKMMELGGNRCFDEFLREHGVPKDMPIREKYTTRAAKWYRENLRAMAEERDPLEPLEPGTGHLPSSDATGQAQLILDQVFATVPNGGAMSSGGVMVQQPGALSTRGAVGGGQSHRPGVRSVRARTRPPPDQERRREARSASAVERGPHTRNLPTWLPMPKQLLRRALALKGNRAADKLRNMSSGKMAGFGPEDCDDMAHGSTSLASEDCNDVVTITDCSDAAHMKTVSFADEVLAKDDMLAGCKAKGPE
mmetsp:Transcript_84435/g.217455  ORF Transcript_84435/g.217455 Transcript_84435/m.217455 type:complete len:322 (-) Transcript_84435:333-1298(-)